MSLDPNYKALLRQSLPKSNSTEPQRKRRRKAAPDPVKIEDKDNESLLGGSDSSDMEFEDVEIEEAQNQGIKEDLIEPPDASNSREASKTPQLNASDDSDNSDDFEDLEDVDIDSMFQAQENPEENLTFTITETKEDSTKSKRKRVTVISKQERQRRKVVHELYLMTMIAHGAIRNRWCNDKTLQNLLLETLPRGISSHFDPDPTFIDYVKQRHFIEGLQKLVKHWRFRVMAQGLVRKDWGELLKEQTLVMRNVDINRFRQTICAYRGSRDLGAQGFVSLLRAYGLNARLVFSLQPPDFRSITPPKDKDEDQRQKSPQIPEKPKSEFDPVFIPDSRAELLQGIRGGGRSSLPKEKSKKKFNFPISQYPVFWAEVLNPYSKKWLTIDPIVNKSVEVMPMRKKGKFEAAALDTNYQTLYVLAFDKAGGVRDVTRRYTQYYNAKTIKKRIDGVSDKEQHWFEQVLKAARSSTHYGLPEIKESREFLLRDQYEGVPNNMNDFKNHPIYALESQLRKDEVIYPNDESSKCGTFRPMNKDSVIPIYKRSHVFRLRTAKAWYLRGRVLKVGAQPLKTKEKQLAQMDEEDEDEVVRLYAEFQTQLFQAPPIVNGEIPKNAYGNVEIFVPSMMPENGYLIPVTDEVTLKMIEKAAREINIDHARAIVAFDFTDKSTKNRRTPAARVGGVLVDVQYKEAIDAVLEGLKDLEEDERRKKVELNALRGWSFFLKKLMIMDRLNRQHGEVEPEEKSEEEGYFSVASDSESGGDDEYNAPISREERMKQKRGEESQYEELQEEEFGGFLPQESKEDDLEEDGQYELRVPIKDESAEPPRDVGEGGFLPQENRVDDDEEGGFLADHAEGVKDEDVEEGGFLAKDDEDAEDAGEGGFLPASTEEGGFLTNDVKDEQLSDSENEGGFIPEDKSESASEESEIYEDVEPDQSSNKAAITKNAQKGAKEDVLAQPSIHDKEVRSHLEGAENSVTAQNASVQEPEQIDLEFFDENESATDSSSEEEKPEQILGNTNAGSKIANESSSTSNTVALPKNVAQIGTVPIDTTISTKSSKTLSFEDNEEPDEELQDEIMKEEAEMGFEYSDSE